MARFNFRHGIARYQEDGTGNPSFLQPSNGGSYIDLIVSPDPTVFVAAHFDADYMFTENASITKAWGPFTSGTTYWLYWDSNFITGLLTRGYTTMEPEDGQSPPLNPAPDQHWFDHTNKVMKVWSGSSWVEYIRVFAAVYTNGAVLSYYPQGSTVGLNGITSYAGTPLFDTDGNPLQKFQRNRRGQFITTETDLHSQLARISNFRVEAAVIQAEAQEEIPIHYCISYSDYSELILSRNTVTNKPCIGLSMEEMNTNEVRAFITKGYVTDQIDWDWSDYTVGTPLFVGPTGQLIPDPPATGMIQQVATVINNNSVFVDIKSAIILGGTQGSSNSFPLYFDSTTGRYVAGSPGSADFLGGLQDVTLLTPTQGETLTYDQVSGQWINTIPTAAAEAGCPLVPNTLCTVGYTFEALTPTTVWTVTHNLGNTDFVTEIQDTSGLKFLPEEIVIVDSNTIEFQFLDPQAGKANIVFLLPQPTL